MKPWPLTLVVAAKNCEDRIIGTLEPWRGLVSEMIVVDQLSRDETVLRAKELGAVVFSREAPNGNFDLNRKFGIEQAKNPWILYLDTDERPTQELKSELARFFSIGEQSEKVQGARIPNEFYFLGKKLRYGIFNPRSAEIRLFKKDSYSYDCEQGFHRGVEVKGKVIRFEHAYRHFNVNSLSEWFMKTNQYTEVDAIEAVKSKSKPRSTLAILFRFIRFFLKHYFVRRGFLDGIHGFLSVTYFGLYHFTLDFKKWEKSYLSGCELETEYLKPISIPERS